jgi:hypothetical protein
MVRIRYILIATIIFMGCEQVIQLDMPPHKPRLVVNAITGADSLFYFQVTQSKSITAPAYVFEEIRNAVIKVYKEGDLVETINQYQEGVSKRGYFSQTRSAAGSNFKIEVDAPGFDQVFASDFAPVRVKIEKVDMDLTTKVKRDDEFYHPLYVTLSDPVDISNFYIMYGVFRFRFSYDNGPINEMELPAFLYSEDPLVQNQNPSDYSRDLFFVDSGFEGKPSARLKFLIRTYDLDFYLNNQMVHTHEAELGLSLMNCSEAFYKYLRGSKMQSDAQSNPFAEPVQVFNNIVNGYGIFGFFANDIYTLNILDQD